MRTTLKIIGATVLIMVFAQALAFGLTLLVERNVREVESDSVFTMSKAEYVEHAVDNCLPEEKSYCRCFYTEILESHTVREVLKMDADVYANPNYEYTDEQLMLAAKCI